MKLNMYKLKLNMPDQILNKKFLKLNTLTVMIFKIIFIVLKLIEIYIKGDFLLIGLIIFWEMKYNIPLLSLSITNTFNFTVSTCTQ